MAELPAGTIFAGHEIRGVAGRGGMGIVYRALDQRLKREVALKVIAPEQSEDREFRVRFRRECEVAASLHHPNLIPVYTAGEEDGHLYVTMRYVDGIDLAHLIDRDGRVPPGRAVDVIAQVAHALDAAHAFGVVHRDVKPANVLLDGDHALLTDFGLQRDLRASTRVTEPGTLIGSFDYTAPEQLEDADVDARTDVYALGCVLFETITGEVPYPRETPAAKMYAHLGAPIPHMDGPLGPVVRKALAKHPDDRFPTAGALGVAAREALGTRPAPPPKPPTPLPTALLTETGSEPFVGRAHFLERIAEHRTAAQTGERRFVLIEGEPGIGKTRLATEAARDAHAAGATVLYGRSDPESLIPFQPFAMALPTVQEQERFAFFDAVTRKLAERPTLLILDDLHWADAATTQLLRHVLEDPGPDEAARPRHHARARPARPKTHRAPHARRARTARAVRVRRRARRAETVHREPQGPARAHRRQPVLRARDPAAIRACPTVSETSSRAASRSWTSATRQALAIAAVIGRDFRLDVLETLADDALDAVEEATAAGLVKQGATADQFLLHARAGPRDARRADEQRPPHPPAPRHRRGPRAPPAATAAELARHFHAARHLDPDRAFTYALKAAQEADHEAAVTYYRHALELRPRLDLELALGEAELRTGDPAFRATFERAATRARDAGDRRGARPRRARLQRPPGGVRRARPGGDRAARGSRRSRCRTARSARA